MKTVKERIEAWLENASRYMTTPSLSYANELPGNIAEVYLDIRSLSCVRKNEKTADEIEILCFWLLEDSDQASIEGIIHLGKKFKREGEALDIDLKIPLIPNSNKATFCLMVYEEDMPILLDPNDPIGLVTFHQNGSMAIYKGDFRQVSSPLSYAFKLNKNNEVELDAENNGCYRLKYRFTSIETS